MKLTIFLLLVSVSCFSQSITNESSGLRYPRNITPYAILNNATGDTVSWFWNRAEILGLYPSKLTNVTGTPSNTTYLRGDNSWSTVSSGGADTVTSGTGLTGGKTSHTNTIKLDTTSTGYTIQYNQTSITSAQILTLNTVPVQLVAAPGSGYIIVPIQIIVDYTFVSAAYATNTSLIIYETSSAQLNQASYVLTQTSSSIKDFTKSSSNTGSANMQYIDNAALMISVSTGNPTAGDCTIKITTYYKTLKR